MIAVLVGRRIDADENGAPAFPLTNVPIVRMRIREVFKREGVTCLVSSAANGADLIALEIALEHQLDCRVFMLGDRVDFRKRSVTDRPGNWGAIFDSIIDRVAADGKLSSITFGPEAADPYSELNLCMLEAAISIAARDGSRGRGSEGVIALTIWDGRPRIGKDYAAEFLELAADRGIRTINISTL